QETLLRAWRSFDALSDETAVRPWLMTIARRELARTFERKRLPLVDIDSALEADQGAFAVEDDHDVREMRRAIMQLDATHREPLVLQVMLGYSTEEIARHLEISLPAVLTRLDPARHALRKHVLGNRAGEAANECGVTSSRPRSAPTRARRIRPWLHTWRRAGPVRRTGGRCRKWIGSSTRRSSSASMKPRSRA